MKEMNIWIPDSQLESMKRFQEWWLDGDRGFHKNVLQYDFTQKYDFAQKNDKIRGKSKKYLNGRSLTKKHQDIFLRKSGRGHR